MKNGWIKLHRKLLDSAIFQNEKLLKVFLWCLLKAAHKGHEQLVGRQTVHLIPGQFVFGRNAAAAELNMAPSTVYDYILLLQLGGTISIKSGNKFSVVTVENWSLYQSEDENSGSKSGNKSATNRQQIGTNNNNKNVKNEKKNKSIHFTPPTIEEVEAYCKERNNGVDPQKWYDFYSAKGWMIGKNKMKDWKAAIRTWERRDNKHQHYSHLVSAEDYDPRRPIDDVPD